MTVKMSKFPVQNVEFYCQKLPEMILENKDQNRSGLTGGS